MRATPHHSDDNPGAFFTRLLGIVAPRHDDVIVLVEAYFDESGTHDGSPALCVAGYIFRSSEALLLDEQWKAVLEEFNLPYFHMVDCAHGAAPFDVLTKDQRIECEKKMIALVNKHAARGLVTLVNEPAFDASDMPKNPWSDAYTWCCFQTLMGVEQWANEVGFEGKIAYFFEAGHKYQSQAQRVMDVTFKSDHFNKKFRYGSHTFIGKKDARPLQSADLLAWQAATDIKRKVEGYRSRRKDYVALLAADTREFIGTRKMFSKFAHLLSLRG